MTSIIFYNFDRLSGFYRELHKTSWFEPFLHKRIMKIRFLCYMHVTKSIPWLPPWLDFELLFVCRVKKVVFFSTLRINSMLTMFILFLWPTSYLENRFPPVPHWFVPCASQCARCLESHLGGGGLDREQPLRSGQPRTEDRHLRPWRNLPCYR